MIMLIMIGAIISLGLFGLGVWGIIRFADGTPYTAMRRKNLPQYPKDKDLPFST